MDVSPKPATGWNEPKNPQHHNWYKPAMTDKAGNFEPEKTGELSVSNHVQQGPLPCLSHLQLAQRLGMGSA